MLIKGLVAMGAIFILVIACRLLLYMWALKKFAEAERELLAEYGVEEI